MRRAILAVLALSLAACDHDRDGGIGDDAAAVSLGSCEVLEATIERNAIREMSASIDGILDSLDRPDARFGAGTPIPVPAAAPGPAGATDFTTTNTQERDVDEPDFVKNDGS